MMATDTRILPMNTVIPRAAGGWSAKLFPGAKARRLVFFTRQLAGFLKNHVPILKALQSIESQDSDPAFCRAIGMIRKDIKEGLPLSDALARQSHFFEPVYIAMVKAGEESGALEETLRILAEHLKKDERARAAVRQALIYPAFLLCAGLGAVVFMLTQVVPKLSGLLQTLHQELPWITKAVIGIGHGIGRLGVPALIAAVAGLFWTQRSSKGKPKGADWALDLPALGNWLIKSETARYTRTVGVALENGVPFVHAMEVASPLLRFQRMRLKIFRVQEAVRKGGFFGAALKQYQAVPPFAAEMIAVGEESGFMKDALMNVAQVYEEEVEDSVKIFLALLEPVLILVVGGLMAIIVLSMMMPIFDIELAA